MDMKQFLIDQERGLGKIKVVGVPENSVNIVLKYISSDFRDVIQLDSCPGVINIGEIQTLSFDVNDSKTLLSSFENEHFWMVSPNQCL